MSDYVVRSQEGAQKAFLLRRGGSDLQHALDLALQRVRPSEQNLARATFYRNFLRDGATLDGVACYVAAIFAAPLRRRPRQG